MQDIIPVNLHERNPKDFKSTKLLYAFLYFRQKK
ncbi:Uncharacterised protein [Limosilactobacillus oris]|nr:Uncharacterised protein [Limosilactobacillus oris]